MKVEQGSSSWHQDNAIVYLVILFAHPRTAFDARLVCRTWNAAVSNGSSLFWREVIGACVPSCEMTLRLLSAATPAYLELRHFSKMSLGNFTTLQHVLMCDTSNRPFLWLTNVPLSSSTQLLYDAASKALADVRDPVEISLIGSGILLERTKTLAEHKWSICSGKRSWRLDLLVIVRGYVQGRKKARDDEQKGKGGDEDVSAAAEGQSSASPAAKRKLKPIDLVQYLSDSDRNVETSEAADRPGPLG